LTALVTDAESATLTAALRGEPALPVAVDLEQQTIVCGDLHFQFTIDPARRARLLSGWDDIDLTESFRSEIDAFKAANLKQRPWTVPI
jgi:3-isopropylmalate/(R)-2-methylmalate dehydratase small subunit